MRKTTIGLVAGLLLTLAVPAIAQTDPPVTDQAQSTELAPETGQRHGLEAFRRVVSTGSNRRSATVRRSRLVTQPI